MGHIFFLSQELFWFEECWIITDIPGSAISSSSESIWTSGSQGVRVNLEEVPLTRFPLAFAIIGRFSFWDWQQGSIVSPKIHEKKIQCESYQDYGILLPI